LDDEGIRYDVGYYSKSLVAAERNYDIWDREYLALLGASYTEAVPSRIPTQVRVYTGPRQSPILERPQKNTRQDPKVHCHRRLEEPVYVLGRKTENAVRAWRTRLGLYALECLPVGTRGKV